MTEKLILYLTKIHKIKARLSIENNMKSVNLKGSQMILVLFVIISGQFALYKSGLLGKVEATVRTRMI